MATTFDDLSKQRIDYSTGPNGETIATLTLTLSDGSVHRFSDSTDEEELDNLGAAFASAEIEQNQISGVAMSEAEIAGMFSSIGKAFKKVARRAAKVATSKVFKKAAMGLAVAAPFLGPLAPAALAVSGGMMVSSQLASAGLAAEAGANKAARKLGLSARRHAKKTAPRNWRTLMNVGNRKRKLAFAHAAKSRQRQQRPNLYQLARAGKIRSNRGGRITPNALRYAAQRGRIFWVNR